MPHRLELALLSAQKDSPWVGNVYNVLHLIWKTYHYGSKSRRELKRLAVELDVSVNNPSGVKGTRWLPHVSRALDVLLKQGKEGTLEDAGQYTAVYAHMDHLAASSMNAEIAGRAKHVKETMEDGSFLAFCHFLPDLFSAISKQLITGKKSCDPTPGQEGHLTNTAATKAVQCFQVFNHDVWPETVEELVDYGIVEVHFLLDHFKVVLERNSCDFALAKELFQALKTLATTGYGKSF